MDSFRHSVQGHPLLLNRDWLLSTQTPSLVHSAAAGAAGPAQSRGMPFQEAPREGSSSVEGGLGLVDMIDMSRTETRKQKARKNGRGVLCRGQQSAWETRFPKGALALRPVTQTHVVFRESTCRCTLS